MKKIISLGMAVVITFGAARHANAQQEAFAMNYIEHRLPIPNWNDAKSEKSESVTSAQVNAKATRDVRRLLGKEGRVNWFRTEETFMAYFQTGEKKGRSVYDLKGNWRYTLHFYPERYMPAGLRDNIRSLYPGYQIKWITEVNRQGEHFFVITVEDASTLLNLLSHDDEVEVMQEYSRG